MSDPRIAFQCYNCGEAIFEDEAYVEVDEQKYCLDCIAGFLKYAEIPEEI